MAVCPSCRAHNPPDAAFCASCGHKIARELDTPVPPTKPSQVAVCTACGAKNPSNHAFCGECGGKLTAAAEDTSAPAKPTKPTARSTKPPPQIEVQMPAGTLPPTRLAQGATCPKCGTYNPEDHTFCRECGARLTTLEDAPSPEQVAEASADAVAASKSAEETVCPICGTANHAGQRFCGQCGNPLVEATAADAPTKKKTRALVSPTEVKQARILVLLADGSAESYPVHDEITIGRDEGEVHLPDDDFLSATHARISRDGDRYVLRDLNSTNGTYVRLQGEIPLRPGDYIMVGDQVFRFVL